MDNKVIQKAFRINKVDAIIFLESKIIFYLTSFSGSESILLINDEKKYLFVDGRYTTQAGNEVDKDVEIISTIDTKLSDFIKDNHIKRVGIEDTVPVGVFNKIALDVFRLDAIDFECLHRIL